MKKEDKKRDPMPPPDATPEEIGEFWDTHDLTDYWDETQEVEIQVDLKSDQNQTQSAETKSDLPTTTEDEANMALDVVPEDTAGTALGVVTNFISGLDPSTWLVRNASKAFSKLCSAPKEWYDAYFEGRAAETRVESEGRVKIREEITAQIVQGIKVDPEYARRAAHKFAEKIIGEQLNLDNISAIAASELENRTSDSSTNPDTNGTNKEQSAGSTNQGVGEPNKEEPANSSNQGVDNDEEKIINDDWLNNFETQARQVSTEDMQRRFGRVLASEIEKPGSYSVRTVKILGELDQNAAALFKKLCSLCVVLGHLPSRYIRDARVCFLSETQGKETLDKYGLGNEQLHLLEEHGLIPSSFYYSEFPYHLCIMDSNNPQLIPLRHQERDWILVPLDRQKSQDFKLSGVAFSKVGRELFHIVDQDPTPEYTDALKKFFEHQRLQMVEVPTQ